MNTQKTKKQSKIIILPVLLSYVLLIILDIVTSYLVSPDLSMEGNLVAKMTGWKGIITLSSIYILSSIFVYCKADKYMNKYFIGKNIRQTIGSDMSLVKSRIKFA